MAETQGYSVGKEGGAFYFGTNPVATISVVDTIYF